MFRLSEKVKQLEDKLNDFISKHKSKFPNWTAFEGLKIDADEQFTVYLKITDYAGHYTYISTDGYIVDMTNSTIAMTPDAPNANGYYKDDVDVDIVVKDASPYSGIKKVEYWVTKDGVETQREILYSFEYVREDGINSNGGSLKIYENGEIVAEEDGYVPTKAQLKNEFTDTITVIANDNNSDVVKVYVQVTDNAGNVTEPEVIDLKIDITEPTIAINYDNNDGDTNFTESTYFKANRTATIVITERNFNADKIDFTIAEGMYQNIQIICNDCAVDEDGKTNTYDETITNVTVTPNGFMIFWANKSLRWGSIAGVILLTAAIIFFIFFKKRKKEEQK